jgi:alkylation response protein AidB-like acyl-CoA dehydrogenase
MLRASVDGAVFAAGHGEAGNDIPLLLSSSQAERVDGGYEFTGHKIFGSLSPVWTYLGVHGLDTSDPENLRVVHGFISRDADNYRIEQTWDVLGMRATESNDTILDHTFVPDDRIALVTPAGFAGATLFQLSIFAWGLLGFATVYSSLAQRAFDETVRRMHRRSSIALTRSLAYHPGVQHEVAEMRISLEAIDKYLGGIVDDWSNGVDHGHDWPLKILAAKYFVVNQAWDVVDKALDLSGGSGIFTRDRMEQMFRDARLGRIHPGNSLLVHEVVGKLSLGINPDESPRWG